MCPACLMTATWAVVGKTSAGGLLALVARNVWGRRSEKVLHGAATHGTGVATAKGLEHGPEPIRGRKGALGLTVRIPRWRNEP